MPEKIVLSITGVKSLEGGIANANYNIINALVSLCLQNEIKFKILSFHEDDNDRLDSLPDIVEFKGYNGSKTRYLFDLYKLSITNPGLFIFDHVHLANSLLPMSILGVAKTVIFAHGSESWKRLKTTSRLSYQSAELCLTNSSYTLKKMKTKIQNFNGEVCLLGLSPVFKLNKNIPDPKHKSKVKLISADGKEKLLNNYFLLVSRLHPEEREKGHYELLEVLPEILRKYDFDFVFAGEGRDKINLINIAKKNGIADKIFFPGFVSTEKLEALYSNCHSYIMPSLQEGFGIASK